MGRWDGMSGDSRRLSTFVYSVKASASRRLEWEWGCWDAGMRALSVRRLDLMASRWESHFLGACFDCPAGRVGIWQLARERPESLVGQLAVYKSYTTLCSLDTPKLSGCPGGRVRS